MSLHIIKAGLLDTVQDSGRYGYQHLGINPGGTMDRFAAAVANALLGKAAAAPVIELHFPAASIRFETAAIFCLAGADFSPVLNGEALPLCQPVQATAGSTLRFQRPVTGARCYLALLNQMALEPWLNSFSTATTVGAGGYKGRSLAAGDRLAIAALNLPATEKDWLRLPWQYRQATPAANRVRFLPGPEWHWLTEESQHLLCNGRFFIGAAANRMACRLQGPQVQAMHSQQLVSSAVTFGTVQLWPDGSLAVLMADHQTTGGYPRVAQVVSADLPLLAQLLPGDALFFSETALAEAEESRMRQQQVLTALRNTCNLKMQTWLYAH